ncbi:MAG TPA: glycosyltransferase family 39 protein [Candidatus Polarisedimenticolia bacterium]|nr:glycosyltransferase family 39 protein [Candidatus Polarisedimenticolia bacterium]
MTSDGVPRPAPVDGPAPGPPIGVTLAVGVLLVLLCAPIVFYRLGRPALGDPDEGRNAEVAREMLASGDFVTPHLNGLRYLDKPPFFFWSVAAADALFGPTEFAARLPSALSSLACILLVAWFARRHAGARAGWLAAAVLALSPLYMVFARLVIFDMMLCLCTSAGAIAAFEALEGDERSARLAAPILFAAAGVGTLTKGPVALLIPLLVAVAWTLLRGRPGLLRRLRFGRGLLLYAAIVLPWLALVAARNPGYLDYALIGENLGRLHSNRFQTSRPWHFYLGVIIPGLFPWIVYVGVAAARRAARLGRGLPAYLRLSAGGDERNGERRDRAGGGSRRRAAVFVVVWLAVLYLFFSLIASKRPSYILPCAVPVALLAGMLWSEACAARRPDAGRPGAAPPGTAADGDPGRDLARRDLAAGAACLAAACGAAAVVIVLVGPGGLARGVGGGQYDAFLSRHLLFGTMAGGLGIACVLLLLTRHFRRPILAFGAAALVIAVGVPPARAALGYVEAARSARPVSRFLRPRLAPDDRVICFDLYRPGLNFYLHRPISLVLDITGPGVLFSSNYIMEHLDEFRRDPSFPLLSDDRLREALRAGTPRAFVLSPRKRYDTLRRRAGVPLEMIYEDQAGGVFVRAAESR